MGVIKLSMRLMADEKYEEASALLIEAIYSGDKNPELYCRLNTALTFMKRYDDVEWATEQALEINGKYPRANYLKALELAEKKGRHL